jgi:hypothetical protein
MALDRHEPKTRPRVRHRAVMLVAAFAIVERSSPNAQGPGNGVSRPLTVAAAVPENGHAAILLMQMERPVSPGGWPRLHLADPVGYHVAREALDLAWRRLAQPDCARVHGSFTDASGHALDERLRAMGVDLQTYLTMLVFIDGSRDMPCVTGVLAFTAPGSRVVRICVDALKRTWREHPEHTVASFIHEMLHTLGLGEDPPSSSEITKRVLADCRRGR